MEKKEIWSKTLSLSPEIEVSNFGGVRKYINGVETEEMNQPVYSGLKCINYKGRSIQVHRLIAEAFVENPKGLKLVKHKNGDKLDNRAENLEWADTASNLESSKVWRDCIFCEELNDIYGSMYTAQIITGLPQAVIAHSINTGKRLCGLTFSKISSEIVESKISNPDINVRARYNFIYLDTNSSLKLAEECSSVEVWRENVLVESEKRLKSKE